jgi:hypothetical protein
VRLDSAKTKALVVHLTSLTALRMTAIPVAKRPLRTESLASKLVLLILLAVWRRRLQAGLVTEPLAIPTCHYLLLSRHSLTVT